jgi:hypothetical protein
MAGCYQMNHRRDTDTPAARGLLAHGFKNSLSPRRLRFAGLIYGVFSSIAAPGCTVPFSPSGQVCGNGVLESGETCDGTDFGPKSCTDLTGHTHGQLSCTADCQIDTSQCHTCGDGIVEGGEQCDRENLAGETCGSLGGSGDGQLSCHPDCTFDLTNCQEICGNAVVEQGEVCDRADLDGATCENLGLGDGTLDCQANCRYDTTGCEYSPEVCPQDMIWCAGACVDTEVDHENCGRCGHQCAAEETCIAGTCTQETSTITLTVAHDGSGSGMVTSSPEGISCPTTCNADFAQGSEVTLAAFPAAGSFFSGWAGPVNANGESCTITANQPTTVTAIFTLESYVLTVSRTGEGHGRITSNPPGIDCGTTCSAEFDHSTQIALSASAATGSAFAGWAGQGCSGTGICSFTLTGPATVTPSFSETLPLDSVVGGGYLAGVVESPSNGSWVVILAPHAQGLSPDTLQWRGPGSGYSVEDGSSLWDGYANTYGMPATNHPAASFCRDLSIDGYSDWYLAAPKEWEVIFANWNALTNALDGLDFSGGSVPSHLRRFWSSHEVTTLAAVLVDPTDGTVPSGGTLKTASHGVFAVRRIPF